jgi:hypothetical protein
MSKAMLTRDATINSSWYQGRFEDQVGSRRGITQTATAYQVRKICSGWARLLVYIISLLNAICWNYVTGL